MFALDLSDNTVVDGQPIHAGYKELTGQQTALINQHLIGGPAGDSHLELPIKRKKKNKSSFFSQFNSLTDMLAQSVDTGSNSQQSQSLVSRRKSKNMLSWLSDVAV